MMFSLYLREDEYLNKYPDFLYMEQNKKRDPNWKWLRELGHKIVLAKKGKREYTRKIKHKLKEIK